MGKKFIINNMKLICRCC